MRTTGGQLMNRTFKAIENLRLGSDRDLKDFVILLARKLRGGLAGYRLESLPLGVSLRRNDPDFF